MLKKASIMSRKLMKQAHNIRLLPPLPYSNSCNFPRTPKSGYRDFIFTQYLHSPTPLNQSLCLGFFTIVSVILRRKKDGDRYIYP